MKTEKEPTVAEYLNLKDAALADYACHVECRKCERHSTWDHSLLADGQYYCRACDGKEYSLTGAPRVPEKEKDKPVGWRSTASIDHPAHYTAHPSGVECITITEHFNFNLGNAMKYIWRAGLKDERRADLEKAAWYIARELQRLGEAP